MTRSKAVGALVIILAFSAGYADVRVYTLGGSLGRVQKQLVISQKASTKTRVLTVGQRCDLTHLILGVLDRVHDEQDAAPFQASLRTCQRQLATVKLINAKTPAHP